MLYLGRAIGMVAVLLATVLLTDVARAAPTAEQRAKAEAASVALGKAGQLAVAQKFEEALPLVIEAQGLVGELSAGNLDGKRLASPLEGRLSAARRILERQGVALPASSTPGTPAAPGEVSFTRQVAPIFVARCNNCHVTGTRGGFNLGTFAALMRGSSSGVVVFPGKSDGSRLMEVLVSGDMPRGGGRLSDEQLDLIGKWIDSGAKFDGPNPNASIAANAPAQPEQRRLEVVQATGSEATKFTRDIAGVLASQCIECHGGAQPSARLGLDTFTRLLAGSDNGLVIEPGKPADSLIIKKLKGLAGERMPLDRPALPPETIALFEKWIAEGAKFDGSDPGQDIDLLARIYRASQMSHDELAAERAEIGLRNWKLSNPDEAPDKVESDGLLLYGNVSEAQLEEVRQVAERAQQRVAKLLHLPAEASLVKGRVTLFVYQRRYDYSEHGLMVEKRELPPHWNGHWRYNVIDAYAAVVLPQNEEYSLEALLGEQLAGIYLESLGEVPGWFSQGTAWAVGSLVDAKDPRSRPWDDRVPAVLSRSSKPDDFLTGKLPPADTALLNYGFCKFLMSNSRNFTALLNGLEAGKDFKRALGEAYRGDANQLAMAWWATGRR